MRQLHANGALWHTGVHLSIPSPCKHKLPKHRLDVCQVRGDHQYTKIDGNVITSGLKKAIRLPYLPVVKSLRRHFSSRTIGADTEEGTEIQTSEGFVDSHSIVFLPDHIWKILASPGRPRARLRNFLAPNAHGFGDKAIR